MPAVEAQLTIAPPPVRSIAGIWWRRQWNTPVRLTARTPCHAPAAAIGASNGEIELEVSADEIDSFFQEGRLVPPPGTILDLDNPDIRIEIDLLGESRLDGRFVHRLRRPLKLGLQFRFEFCVESLCRKGLRFG